MVVSLKRQYFPASLVLLAFVGSGSALAAGTQVQFRNLETGNCLQATSNQFTETAACDASEPRQFFSNINNITNIFGACLSVGTRYRASPWVTGGVCNPSDHIFGYDQVTQVATYTSSSNTTVYYLVLAR